jgi:NAD(P)-dependent dehydrogenase (short-subunit alcohol dehydrogenase family)
VYCGLGAKVPLGRLARIDDIVAFVKFLTVDGDYCTGQAFNVTGGRELHYGAKSEEARRSGWQRTGVTRWA